MTARLKVLHVVRPANLSGAPVVVLHLVHRLAADHPVDAAVFCGRDEGLPGALAEAGIDVQVCPDLVRSPAPWRDFRAFLALRRRLGGERFDVVHTHSSKSGVLGRWAARLAGVPAIVHTVHGIPWVGNRLYQAIEALTGRVTDRFVALSAADRERLTGLGLADEASVRVIPNGMPVAELRQAAATDLRSELDLPETAPLVGMAGRLKPQKRPDLFVRMAAEVLRSRPDCRFVLAGDGPLLDSTRTLAATLGIAPRVHFLGWRDDLTGVLRGLDVLALTSEWEGLPLVLIEAALAEVPVLATDVRGCRDVVRHGETGLLAQPEPAALAAVLLRLLDDPWLGRRLAAAARREAEREYDVAVTARATYELYLEILRHKNRAPRTFG